MAKSTIKFKDSEAEFRAIAANIKAGKIAPIYLLMGEEAYFIDHLCDLLATTILTEAERSFNQITLYGKDSNAGTIVNFCRQMPMMGSKEVIIVKEAQQLTDAEKLSAYTSHPQPSTVLIICYKEKTVDKRSLLYKSSLAAGVVFESVRPRDYEIGDFLTAFVRAKGCSIEPKAVAMLTDYLGTDLKKIDNELQKLLVSMPQGSKEITCVDIEANIGISKDFNNYELCAAVAQGDMKRALTIADFLGRNPKNTLLLTVMALFGTFKEIFIYNYLTWLSKHKGQPMPPDTELYGLTGARNIVALRNLKQNAPKWPNRNVFTILGLMREYDAKSKGMNTGAATEGELLQELLIKIFTA